MAVLIVCGVDEHGQRDILAAEPMLEESEDTCLLLFRGLQERGLRTPRLIISDAHSGLVAAIRKGFPGASWQRCKVHFMRNILAHVPHKEKNAFAQQLKAVWLASTREQAYRRAEELCQQYERRFPKAIRCPEDGLEDSLVFYTFPQLDARKISSTNVLERLNREIRRRTNVVGIFPDPNAYTRLVTTYLMEYAEDWVSFRAYLNEQSVQNLLDPIA